MVKIKEIIIKMMIGRWDRRLKVLFIEYKIIMKVKMQIGLYQY